MFEQKDQEFFQNRIISNKGQSSFDTTTRMVAIAEDSLGKYFKFGADGVYQTVLHVVDRILNHAQMDCTQDNRLICANVFFKTNMDQFPHWLEQKSK